MCANGGKQFAVFKFVQLTMPWLFQTSYPERYGNNEPGQGKRKGCDVWRVCVMCVCDVCECDVCVVFMSVCLYAYMRASK